MKIVPEQPICRLENDPFEPYDEMSPDLQRLLLDRIQAAFADKRAESASLCRRAA